MELGDGDGCLEISPGPCWAGSRLWEPCEQTPEWCSRRRSSQPVHVLQSQHQNKDVMSTRGLGQLAMLKCNFRRYPRRMGTIDLKSSGKIKLICDPDPV